MAFCKLTDDRGKKFVWPTPPRRIVSLVPSDTYSLVRIGAGDRLVGRTRYCVEPAADVVAIEEIGGTKDVDVDRIIALEPQLVIANQEENTRSDLEKLDAAGIYVFVSFPKTVAAGLAHVARLALGIGMGRGADAAEPARSVIAAAYHALDQAQRAAAIESPVRAFVPIWMDPLMTANDATFMADALRLAGATNVFGDRDRKYPLAADLARAAGLPPDRVVGRDTRYPRITLDEVRDRAPELVLLPNEPHPFTEADGDVFRALDVPAAHSGNIVSCDGRDLMWYGLRTVEGLSRLRTIVARARPN